MTTTGSTSLTPTRLALIVGTGALLVGLVAGPVLAGALAPQPYQPVNGATDQPPEHTISVAGLGKVVVVPDLATVRLGVDPRARHRQGRTGGRRRVDDPRGRRDPQARHRGQGHRDRQRVAGPGLQLPQQRGPQDPRLPAPEHRHGHGPRRQHLSDVLDDGVAAGATSVEGISYDVADRAASEAKAREAAVADAKAKADTLASGLGVRISGVANVSESGLDPDGTTRTWPVPAPSADRAAAGTPVLPGTTDVVITVQVTFLIPYRQSGPPRGQRSRRRRGERGRYAVGTRATPPSQVLGGTVPMPRVEGARPPRT